jgi:hypothetical protein
MIRHKRLTSNLHLFLFCLHHYLTAIFRQLYLLGCRAWISQNGSRNEKRINSKCCNPLILMVGGGGFECARGTQAPLGIAFYSPMENTRLRRAATHSLMNQAIFVLDRISEIFLGPVPSCDLQIVPCTTLKSHLISVQLLSTFYDAPEGVGRGY